MGSSGINAGVHGIPQINPINWFVLAVIFNFVLMLTISNLRLLLPPQHDSDCSAKIGESVKNFQFNL